MDIRSVVVFSLLCIFCSCNSPYFEQEKEIENGIWTYDNPFSLSFEPGDTLTRYDLLLEIEHDQSYPYQNIYFKLQTVFPDGDTLADPFSVNLSDKFGVWNGDCWGDECSLTVPIQTNVKFESMGTYQLSFTQYTRQDSLKGIQGLEFSIVQNDSNSK